MRPGTRGSSEAERKAEAQAEPSAEAPSCSLSGAHPCSAAPAEGGLHRRRVVEQRKVESVHLGEQPQSRVVEVGNGQLTALMRMVALGDRVAGEAGEATAREQRGEVGRQPLLLDYGVAVRRQPAGRIPQRTAVHPLGHVVAREREKIDFGVCWRVAHVRPRGRLNAHSGQHGAHLLLQVRVEGVRRAREGPNVCRVRELLEHVLVVVVRSDPRVGRE
eukprot:404970-Prymnesium_polylepis.1